MKVEQPYPIKNQDFYLYLEPQESPKARAKISKYQISKKVKEPSVNHDQDANPKPETS